MQAILGITMRIIMVMVNMVIIVIERTNIKGTHTMPKWDLLL